MATETEKAISARETRSRAANKRRNAAVEKAADEAVEIRADADQASADGAPKAKKS